LFDESLTRFNSFSSLNVLVEMTRHYKVFISDEQVDQIYKTLSNVIPLDSDFENMNEYLTICNSLISLNPEKSLKICESLNTSFQRLINDQSRSYKNN
jgi:hypothetical protein